MWRLNHSDSRRIEAGRATRSVCTPHSSPDDARAWARAFTPALLGVALIATQSVFVQSAAADSTNVICWGAGEPDDGPPSPPPAGSGGYNPANLNYGQSTVPRDLGHCVLIDAGWYHTVAVRDDGSVDFWGFDEGTQMPHSLSPEIVEISAGGNSLTVVRLMSGELRAWGGWFGNPGGIGAIPNEDPGPFTMVSAGWNVLIALRPDGSLMVDSEGGAWESKVPAGAFKFVAAGVNNLGAIDPRGAVMVWGDSFASAVPPNASPATRISLGYQHAASLREDGTVVCWGDNTYHQCDVPADLGPCIDVQCGMHFTVALTIRHELRYWGDLDPLAIVGADVDEPPPEAALVDRISVGAYHCVAIVDTDCDGNGLIDVHEMQAADWLDCDQDGVFDACPDQPIVPAPPAKFVQANGGAYESGSSWCLGVVPPSFADLRFVIPKEAPGAPYTVTASADHTARSATVERGDVTFSFSGRKLLLANPADPNSAVLRVGVGGDAPILRVIGGTVQSKHVRVPDAPRAAGAIEVSAGGKVTASGSLDVAPLPGSAATVDIGSAGTLLAQTIRVGDQGGGTGTLHLGSGGQATSILGVNVYSGTVALDSGSLLTASPVGVIVYESGSVTGGGTIIGSLTNFGSECPAGAEEVCVGGGVAPGAATNLAAAGTLQVMGDYVQVPAFPKLGLGSGSLRIDVAGARGGVVADRVEVSGTATLGGGVFITLETGLDPEDFANVPILTAGAIDVEHARFDVAFTQAISGDRYIKVAPLTSGVAGEGIGISTAPLPVPFGFGDPDGTTTPLEPAAAVVGDFKNDGDGLLDVAVALKDENELGSLLILLNDGTGHFTGQIQELALGVDPVGLTAGRFRLGGPIDLAAVNRGSESLQILFNDGAGTFSLVSTIPLAPGSAPTSVSALQSIAVAPPEGMLPIGFDDLFVTHGGTDSGLVLGNDGAGNFAVKQEFKVGADPSSADPAPLDPDRPPEIPMACMGSSTVEVWDADPTGFYGSPSIIPVGAAPVSVKSVDLDLDGKNDFVTTNADGNSISVIINKTVSPGEKSFAPAVNLPVGGNPASLAAGDFDGDGDPDLAVIADTDDGAGREIKVIRNDTDALEEDPQLLLVLVDPLDPGPGTPLFLVTSDFDGDAKSDLTSVNAESGGNGVAGEITTGVVRSFLSSAPRALEGDANGDGTVDGADIAMVLGSWGACPKCPADLNDDGVVDGADITIVLGNWGATSGAA